MAGSGVKTSTEEIFSHELDEMIHDYLAAEPNSQARDKIRDKIVARVMPYVKRIAYGLARRSTDPAEDPHADPGARADDRREDRLALHVAPERALDPLRQRQSAVRWEP